MSRQNTQKNRRFTTSFQPNYAMGKKGKYICFFCPLHCKTAGGAELQLWIVFIIDSSIDFKFEFSVQVYAVSEDSEKCTLQVPRVQGDMKNQERLSLISL